MKTICTMGTVWILLFSPVSAQQSGDPYETGIVRLIIDPEYGKDTQWETIFQHVSNRENPQSSFCDIAVLDDGSAFLLDHAHHQIFKFDPHGNFIKKFGSEGDKPAPHGRRPNHIEVLDNQYLIVNEHIWGRISIFDLEGNFIKRIAVDYSIRDLIALQDEKIVIQGWVIIKGSRAKDHVAILDIHSGKEKPVIHFMQDLSKQMIPFKTKDRGMMGVGNPFRHFTTCLLRVSAERFIVGYSQYPDIYLFSSDGNEISRFQVQMSPPAIQEEDIDQFVGGLQKSIEKYNLPDTVLNVLESPDFFPDHLPFYYHLMLDADGHLLVFEQTDGEEHHFHVYSITPKPGERIGEATLNPDPFDNPRISRGYGLVQFHDGHLYGLVQRRRDDGYQLRMIKADLSSRDQ